MERLPPIMPVTSCDVICLLHLVSPHFRGAAFSVQMLNSGTGLACTKIFTNPLFLMLLSAVRQTILLSGEERVYRSAIKTFREMLSYILLFHETHIVI